MGPLGLTGACAQNRLRALRHLHPVGTLKPGTQSLPARGQATGLKAQSQPQPDCPQGVETTGRGNPSSRPSPKSLVAASAQSERALLPAGPLRRPTRVPLVSSSSPWTSRLARPQGPVRAGMGCGASESSAGPGSTWFRVPGPAAKRSRRARPLPGGLSAPSCASRARHGSGEEGLRGARPIPQGPRPRVQVPGVGAGRGGARGAP